MKMRPSICIAREKRNYFDTYTKMKRKKEKETNKWITLRFEILGREMRV